MLLMRNLVCSVYAIRLCAEKNNWEFLDEI